MSQRCKKVITLLFFLYLIIVLRITVFRSTFSLQQLCQNGKINLTLFEGYIALLRQKNWFSFGYLFLGNILWFVPFGMYLQYMKKTKTLFCATVCGFLFSFLIETMQFVFGTGLSELDDLILNTFGTWVGAALGSRLHTIFTTLTGEWTVTTHLTIALKELLFGIDTIFLLWYNVYINCLCKW